MRKRCAILLLMLAMAAGNAAIAQMQWRELTPAPGIEQRVTDIEISGKNGVITIRTPRRITVRVFTILGQSVNSATLNAGIHELRIAARGIYIVRVGNITQIVAL